MKLTITTILAATALFSSCAVNAQTLDQWYLDLYGASYHFQKRVSPATGERYNELNLGAGIEVLKQTDSHEYGVTAGGYYNSFSTLSLYGGGVYRWCRGDSDFRACAGVKYGFITGYQDAGVGSLAPLAALSATVGSDKHRLVGTFIPPYTEESAVVSVSYQYKLPVKRAIRLPSQRVENPVRD